MLIDFQRCQDLESFVSVPPGTYICRIDEVRVGRTREDEVRWAFKLVVDEGEYCGRTAAWDGLTFSERGMLRVKHVLERLGFDVSGTLELEPDALRGLRAQVVLVQERRHDELLGRTVERLRVPYNGYETPDAYA